MSERSSYLDTLAEMRLLAREFEEQMRAIQTAAKMTDGEVAKLRERVLEMATHVPDPPIIVLRREGRKITQERSS